MRKGLETRRARPTPPHLRHALPHPTSPGINEEDGAPPTPPPEKCQFVSEVRSDIWPFWAGFRSGEGPGGFAGHPCRPGRIRERPVAAVAVHRAMAAITLERAVAAVALWRADRIEAALRVVSGKSS